MSSFINSIGIANPAYKFDQLNIADFMANALGMNAEIYRKLMVLYRASGIKSRYSVIPDFGLDTSRYSFFPSNEALEPLPGVKQRMLLYEKNALPLAAEAINNCLSKLKDFDKENITHLITVSCTGMYAPGLDIELLEHLDLPSDIQRTCINFMGCYAAFNALKVANSICQADPDAHVMVVSVELCTIHYQKSMEWDHILSNALFADGAAACMVSGKKMGNRNLALNGFHCDIESSGKNDMAWQISDFGFEMTLSSYVPGLIKEGIGKLTYRLLEKASLNTDEIDFYAIHPGGKRILEAIEEELDISKYDNRYSYEVLREYGNMSSATVLFVLENIMRSLNATDQGKNILSFAFGPGLTLESMILNVEIGSEKGHISNSENLAYQDV